MRHITFETPSGIGDVSWCYSKLIDLIPGNDISIRLCSDHPKRAKEFVDILPGIRNLGYGGHYLNMQKRLISTATDLATLPDTNHAISLNLHLEAGHRIETAFPKQRTHFHYEFNTTAEHKTKAAATVAPIAGPRIGFYCSSYQHRPDLAFFSVEQWCEFLYAVASVIPDITFVAIGAPYDDKTFEVMTKLLLQKRVKVVDAIGMNHIGTTLELIRQLDYFFAFPSGLGVISDVIKTPCTMFYWSDVVPHVRNFPGSYADPESLATNRYIVLPYANMNPQVAFASFKERGLQWVDKRLEMRKAH